MNEAEAKNIVDTTLRLGSETASVEFKDSRGGLPRDIWRTISSFTHRPNGGCIIFGIKEDQKKKIIEVTGAGDIASLQEKIGDLVSTQMSTVIRPEYYPIEKAGRTLLVLYIPECPDQLKPCYYKPVGIPNGAYVRDGNSDRKITDAEMRRFLENAKLSKFDISRAEDSTLEDLSAEKILGLLTRTGQRTERETKSQDVDFALLKNLGLADEFKDGRFPTVAGFLVFSQAPPQTRRPFSRYIIRCVKYKGSNVATDIIDSTDVDGTLDEQIEAVQKFILRNIRKSAEIVGAKRLEKYEYPEKAIREVVANAVIHRDYRITETYTQINLFDDRLEIFNPGCLPPGVTVENIRDAQVSRNEIIAARLKDLDYLEEYGRGIDIVFNEMKAWGLLPPIFKNTTNSFKVILPGEKLADLNDRQLIIWNHLVDHKRITAKECAAILPETPRPTINYDLSKMQELGLIHSIGESRSTYYEPNF